MMTNLSTSLRRLGIVAVAVAATGIALAVPASAHTRLISSNPGRDSSVPSVSEVSLEFNEPLSSAKVLVRDATGKAVQSGEAKRTGKIVTQKLAAPTAAGSYTIAYRVVGLDGHPIDGTLKFTATGAGGASAGATTPEPDALSTVAPDPAQAGELPADDEGSGAMKWLLVIAGAVLGIGLGLGFVFLRKRRPAASGE